MKRQPAVLMTLPAVMMTLAIAGTIAGCAGTTVVHTTSAEAELQSIRGSGAATAPNRPAGTRPTATASPVTTDGDCPFLDTAFVQDTVGQHIGRVTSTSTAPASCAYFRADGGPILSVDRSTYADASAAAAAGRAKTGSDANPVSDIGDGGTVAITGTGAVMAVTQGPVLIVVQLNQQSSLECHELAARSLPQ